MNKFSVFMFNRPGHGIEKKISILFSCMSSIKKNDRTNNFIKVSKIIAIYTYF